MIRRQRTGNGCRVVALLYCVLLTRSLLLTAATVRWGLCFFKIRVTLNSGSWSYSYSVNEYDEMVDGD